MNKKKHGDIIYFGRIDWKGSSLLKKKQVQPAKRQIGIHVKFVKMVEKSMQINQGNCPIPDLQGRQILIVEDNRLFSMRLREKLRESLDLESTICCSFKETRTLLEIRPENFFLAIVDLHLPDAMKGEAIDYVLQKGLPTIVATGDFTTKTRDSIIKKRILDYVIKNNRFIFSHLISTVERFLKNHCIRILIVDDSKSARFLIKEMLELHKFQTFEAENGQIALDILKQDPEIRMVITDNVMPEMDGFELTKQIRQRYSKNELAVIGISSHKSGSMTANYLKNGANDFIQKPFDIEEFYQRVIQNLELMEYIELLKDSATKDYLTGVYNRRYFFQLGVSEFIKATEKNNPIIVSMLDIDNFKGINDTYGHHSGDLVIKSLADLLKRQFHGKSHIVARFGGEEFCVLSFGLETDQYLERMEGLRLDFQKSEFRCIEQCFSATVSIGACKVDEIDMTSAIKKSDELLYAAKSSGKNKIVKNWD